MEKRLRSFADAGVTDLNARIVPLGEGRDEIKASAERTREFLAAGGAGAAQGAAERRAPDVVRAPLAISPGAGDDAGGDELPHLLGGPAAVAAARCR